MCRLVLTGRILLMFTLMIPNYGPKNLPLLRAFEAKIDLVSVCFCLIAYLMTLCETPS